MTNTKLILIEGIPGAGKTTSCIQLGRMLQEQAVTCRWYLEEDDPHPIDCTDLKLKDLARKLPPMWSAFVAQALRKDDVSIIESRLWQNTLLFMFMSEYPLDEILDIHKMVWKELSPLNPVLIVLYQDDIQIALKRLYTMRNKELIEKDIKTTSQYAWFRSRDLNDLSGWVQFFNEWQAVAAQLFRDWPYAKIKITNPHDDWGVAYQEMVRFFELNENLSDKNI